MRIALSAGDRFHELVGRAEPSMPKAAYVIEPPRGWGVPASCERRYKRSMSDSIDHPSDVQHIVYRRSLVHLNFVFVEWGFHIREGILNWPAVQPAAGRLPGCALSAWGHKAVTAQIGFV